MPAPTPAPAGSTVVAAPSCLDADAVLLPRSLRGAPAILDLYEQGGIDDAEVHVTDAIARLTGTDDADVLLAIALAVRAPRLGHVCLELPRLAEVGLAAEGGERIDLALPSVDTWRRALAASPAVRGADEQRATPLVLDGTRLYLDRYWRYEQRLVAQLRRLVATDLAEHDAGRVASPDGDADADAVVSLDAVLDRLFPGTDDQQQRRAAALAATRALTVLTGGPGTGKTTTVVRVLAALLLSAPPDRVPRAVLAAPTGKAAARMAEAVRDSASTLQLDPIVHEALESLPALTVHRLLGYRPATPTRFRHNASNPLPYDVVVLDEASMASLPLMAALIDALADGTRLLLLGDPDQLASVDAGAVLSDICDPGAVGVTDGGRELGAAHAGAGEPGAGAGAGGGAGAGAAEARIGKVIVRLSRFYRFGSDSGIGAVARAIRRIGTEPGATAEVVELLRGQRTEPGGPDRYDDIALCEPVPAGVRRGQPRQSGAGGGSQHGTSLPRDVLSMVVDAYAQPVRLAREHAEPSEVLRAYDELRVLAALRRGPAGVFALDRAIAAGLARAGIGFDDHERFPVGQLLMIIRNDHRVGLYNGDIGVVVGDPHDPDRRRIAFPSYGGEVRLLAPARLPEHESVFAMSIHKSQGSQYGHVVVVLPDNDSPLLTRELLYTGITRARSKVTVVADEPTLVRTLSRRVQRASGLTERLWAEGGAPTTDDPVM